MEPIALEPLAPSARLLFHASAGVRLVTVWLPASLALGVAAGFCAGPWVGLGVGAAIGFLALIASVWWPSLSYERYGWALTDRELLVRRGVIFRSTTAIPVARVQHVDLRQGPLELWLALARIHVHTASGLGSDGVIPGLEVPRAEALRDALVASVRSADDGV